ncbi:MAG: hypothetical protein R3F49_24080 [Planctomycetota bacterium]
MRTMIPWTLAVSLACSLRAQDPPAFAEVRVVDARTGRGVPLVELATVHHVRFVTDNAGRIAIADPELLGRDVYFTLRSHGYEVPADGFGFRGVRVTPTVGSPVQVDVRRINIAERICRLTGEGRWRDSALLGYAAPPFAARSAARIAGQDTVQAAAHRGKLWFLWGDTARLEYPLGLFRTAGATLPLPFEGPLDQGLPYDVFTDPATGFARAMMPLYERPEGVIWMHALASVPDAEGTPRLVAHYSRRASLQEELEQGIAVLDEATESFTVARQLPASEPWRHPSGHPLRVEEEGRTWLYYGSPTPNVRVEAQYEAVLDPTRYEALTCAESSGSDIRPRLNAQGAPLWRWQSELPPTTSEQEAEWVRHGELDAAHARFLPANALDATERVVLHRGTVRWNRHRGVYVLLACQVGGTSSYLGELWYAESTSPTGPFPCAVKVVTHDQMSFYNPCHHDFLDRERGRIIHFEGTYTHLFAGEVTPTPRYEYNQILYRLDLDAPALVQPLVLAAADLRVKTHENELLCENLRPEREVRFLTFERDDTAETYGVYALYDQKARMQVPKPLRGDAIAWPNVDARAALVRLITQTGRSEGEARLLVEREGASWFAPGSRVLFVVAGEVPPGPQARRLAATWPVLAARVD